MNNSKAFRLIALLFVAPSIAHASDPTGLYVLIVGFPAVLISLFNIFLAIKRPEISLIVSSLLASLFGFLVIWSIDVGYMRREGGYLISSSGLLAISVIIAIAKILNKRDESWVPSYDWVCSSCGMTNEKNTRKCMNCGSEV